MHPSALSPVIYLIIISLAVIALLSVKANKLTPAGGITGFVVACIIYAGTAVVGVVLLALFFGLGVAASRWKGKDKYAGTRQDSAEARNAGQVLANAGVAALMALLNFMALQWFPGWVSQYPLVLPFMLAGSLAAATGDTLSSELGIVYSTRFFNCLTLKPDTRGQDGVISIEGLLFGAAGSFVIALVAVLLSGMSQRVTGMGAGKYLLAITLAGVIGNYADSVLGATLERKGRLGNNAVNFLCTLIGAISFWPILKITG